jgi:hypothetical protein
MSAVVAAAERILELSLAAEEAHGNPLVVAESFWVAHAARPLDDTRLDRGRAPGFRALLEAARMVADPRRPGGWLRWRDSVEPLDEKERVRVAYWCEPLLARVDAKEAWYHMGVVVPEAKLMTGGMGVVTAVAWRLQRPGEPGWLAALSAPPPWETTTRIVDAAVVCVDAAQAPPGDAVLRRRLLDALADLSDDQCYPAAELHLVALALIDAAEAWRIHEDRDHAWAAEGAINSAFALMARHLVATTGEAAVIDRLRGEGYVTAACQRLARAALAGALSPRAVLPLALELAARIDDELGPPAWTEAIEPLAAIAAAYASVPLLEKLCYQYLPRPEMLVEALASGATVLWRQHPERVEAFVAALATNQRFVEIFAPPEPLHSLPLRGRPPGWWFLVHPAPPERKLQLALDVLLTRAASPYPAIWHRLAGVLPWLDQAPGTRPIIG